MPKPYFDIQQFGEQTDIYIFGDITRYADEASQETSGHSLVQQLKKIPDAAEINLHIDSFGGNISEGWAIYNALQSSRARVTSYADGFVASAAIYPFLAGQERIASNVSAFYFHPASQLAAGYAEDLRSAADALDQLTEIGGAGRPRPCKQQGVVFPCRYAGKGHCNQHPQNWRYFRRFPERARLDCTAAYDAA